MEGDVRKLIPDGITRSHILKAIEEIAAGRMYDFGQSTDYDLEHEGSRYPPKAVIGIAAMYANGEAMKPEQFTSGLDSKCFRILKEQGFAVIEKENATKRRNPDWTRDEIMLALEFYLDNSAKLPGKGSDPVAKLSEEIRRLAAAFSLTGDEKFRNANGVYMKVMNIRSHDPTYTSQGKVGLSAANRLEQEVWDRFGSDLQGLKAATAEIREQLQQGDTEFLSAGYDEPEIAEAAEGRIVTRQHRVRERSRKLVDQKKKVFRKDHGGLFCEACEFDFSKVYGSRGDGYIECHHTKPLHEMKQNEKTRLSDLALVCANCHRMIHAKRPWLTMPQLGKLLRN